MNAYIYNIETNNVIAQIRGNDNQSIEAKFNEIYTGNCMLTYSPAFGAVDGLSTDGDFDVVDVRG